MKPPDAFTLLSAEVRFSTSVTAACASRTAIAEHLLLQLREIREILIDESIAAAAEAREPILHVGRVTRLGELAVVDDIDAGVGLLLHNIGDRPAHAHPKRL